MILDLLFFHFLRQIFSFLRHFSFLFLFPLVFFSSQNILFEIHTIMGLSTLSSPRSNFYPPSIFFSPLLNLFFSSDERRGGEENLHVPFALKEFLPFVHPHIDCLPTVLSLFFIDFVCHDSWMTPFIVSLFWWLVSVCSYFRFVHLPDIIAPYRSSAFHFPFVSDVSNFGSVPPSVFLDFVFVCPYVGHFSFFARPPFNPTLGLSPACLSVRLVGPFVCPYVGHCFAWTPSYLTLGLSRARLPVRRSVCLSLCWSFFCLTAFPSNFGSESRLSICPFVRLSVLILVIILRNRLPPCHCPRYSSIAWPRIDFFSHRKKMIAFGRRKKLSHVTVRLTQSQP